MSAPRRVRARSRLGLAGVAALGGLASLAGLGCPVPEPSKEFRCSTTSDCRDGRVCDRGFCVVGSEVVDAAGGGDGATAPRDADPRAILAAECMAAGYMLAAGPDGYYRSGVNSTSWTNAQAACAADVPGKTHLIVLSSQAEVTFLTSRPGWIGLSDRAIEGTFVTVTGELDDLRPFAPGQPDNGSGNEDCVQLKQGGLLDDDQCGNSHPYTCECDGLASTP